MLFGPTQCYEADTVRECDAKLHLMILNTSANPAQDVMYAQNNNDFGWTHFMGSDIITIKCIAGNGYKGSVSLWY